LHKEEVGNFKKSVPKCEKGHLLRVEESRLKLNDPNDPYSCDICKVDYVRG
jgi:hypothetical protein